MTERKFQHVGTRPIRPDGVDKVTGRASYGADLAMPGMIHGVVLRSPHAHARILSIDTKAAEEMPGVKAVITSADLPDLPADLTGGIQGHVNFRELSCNVMARDKVLYNGHPIAAVAAGDDITGVVTSANGPEAGVWVIAETSEFDTKFAKIVVTDDRGRFVLPQLPDAAYDVWVRGYGLVDSEKVTHTPGDEGVALQGVVAPTARDAAQYYPGNYWYSLVEPPAASQAQGPVVPGPACQPPSTPHKHILAYICLQPDLSQSPASLTQASDLASWSRPAAMPPQLRAVRGATWLR